MIKEIFWATLANFGIGPDAGSQTKLAPITADVENGLRRDQAFDAGKYNYMLSELCTRANAAQWLGAKTSVSGLKAFTPLGCVEWLDRIKAWSALRDNGGSLQALIANASHSAVTGSASAGAPVSGIFSCYAGAAGTGPFGVEVAAYTYSGTNDLILVYDSDLAIANPPQILAAPVIDSYKDIVFDGVNILVNGTNQFARVSSAGAWSTNNPGSFAGGGYVDQFWGAHPLATESIIFSPADDEFVSVTKAGVATAFSLTVNGSSGQMSTWATPWVGRPIYDSQNGRWVVQAGDLAAHVRWYYLDGTELTRVLAGGPGESSYLVGQGAAEVAPGVLAVLGQPTLAASGDALVGVPEVLLSFDGAITWHRTGARMSTEIAVADTNFRDGSGLHVAAGGKSVCAWSHDAEYLVLGPYGSLGTLQ